MSVVERAAWAKVNLALAVGPPRAGDGYHPICSWFVPIDLCDDVRLERLGPGEKTRVTIQWAPDAPRPSLIDWPIEKDLCFRAHALLEREAGFELPTAITVRKRIPCGGGLGGGSSDAAATLLGLRALHALAIDDARLASLAMALGSDVAYFLSERPRAAVVEGVGERITIAPCEPAWLGLILPPMGCPTAAVYAALDSVPLDSGARAARFADDSARVWSLACAGRAGHGAELFNDLAEPALRVAPGLRQILERARAAAGADVHITGSGSTTFFVCADKASRDGALERLSAALPPCAVIGARSIG